MASIARSCDDYPLTVGHRVLEAIRLNIAAIRDQLRTCCKNERQRLQRELKTARRQEREAQRYV